MIYEDKWIFEGDSRIEMAALIILLRYLHTKSLTDNHPAHMSIKTWLYSLGVTLPESLNFNVGMLQCYSPLSIQILAYEPLVHLYLDLKCMQNQSVDYIHQLFWTENIKIYIEKIFPNVVTGNIRFGMLKLHFLFT